MASKESEKSIVEQKYADVKRELAMLRDAIKKHEEQSYTQEKPADTGAHTIAELFVREKKVKEEHDILVARLKNRDKDGTAEQFHPTLDVSPGDHTVVEL